MVNGSTSTGSVPLILALGGPPLLKSGGPSSTVDLASLPIVNSHAESAAMLADPMVGYWCRVGSLALTHTHNDVAILVQWRTLLSIFLLSRPSAVAPRLLAGFIRELPGLVAALPAGSSPLVRSRLRALCTTGLFVANACWSCLVLGRSLQLGSWACFQMPPVVLHTITSMASGLYPKPCPSFGSMPKPCSCYLSNLLGFGPRCFFRVICSSLACCLLVLFGSGDSGIPTSLFSRTLTLSGSLVLRSRCFSVKMSTFHHCSVSTCSPSQSALSVQRYSQGRQWLSHRLNLLVSRPPWPVF